MYLIGLAALVGGMQAGAPSAAAQSEPEIVWHDASKKLVIAGQGWTATKARYDRLPAKAEGIVRQEVWDLSRDSAGLRTSFITDASSIRVRWTVGGGRLAMPHMPATGVSGLDLYVKLDGTWQFAAVARPTEHPTNEATLVSHLDATPREYRLYFPLYNSLTSLEIGLPPEAKLAPVPDNGPAKRPIVFYGTSILQGGCASRPGMAYTAILDRQLDWPVINLGFSGNGKTEPEMAELLAELDPSVYVMDSLPNLSPEETAERVEPFVRRLREAHPETPIVLVENVPYTNARLIASRRDKYQRANRALREIHQRLQDAGWKRLWYIPAEALFGDDTEATVDGTHPNDLGFMRMAEAFAPVLREALAQPSETGFQSLFDGKTLNGWHRLQHVRVNERNLGGEWKVVDGVLVGHQDAQRNGSLLVTGKNYSDIELRLEVMMDHGFDSGIFLRAGNDGPFHQLTLDWTENGFIGGIHVPLGRNMIFSNPEGERAFYPERWNAVRLIMEGNPGRLRFWLNGTLVTDYTYSAGDVEGIPLSGGIAVQIHSGNPKQPADHIHKKVRFRNIRVKELR